MCARLLCVLNYLSVNLRILSVLVYVKSLSYCRLFPIMDHALLSLIIFIHTKVRYFFFLLVKP